MRELDMANFTPPEELRSSGFNFPEATESPIARQSGFKIGQLLVGKGGKVLDVDFETCSQLGCNYLETLQALEAKKLVWTDLFSSQAGGEVSELNFDGILSENSNLELEAVKIVSASGVNLYVNISIWTIDDVEGNFAVVFVSDARRKSYFDNMQKLVLSDLISDYASSLMWSCKSLIDRMDPVESKGFELLFFEMANIDVLTNLPNRKMFLKVLGQIISESLEMGSLDDMGIAVIQLNGIKEVNEKYGLEHGDLMLNKVALQLKKIMRKSDLVGRLGGTKFAMALPGMKEQANLDIVAKRILKNLSQEGSLDDEGLLSVSIGMALFPDAGETVDQLINGANSALDKAKKLKGNKHKVFAAKGSHAAK